MSTPRLFMVFVALIAMVFVPVGTAIAATAMTAAPDGQMLAAPQRTGQFGQAIATETAMAARESYMYTWLVLNTASPPDMANQISACASQNLALVDMVISTLAILDEPAPVDLRC